LTGAEPLSSHPDPEKAWSEVERGQLVEMALKTLPEKERAAVVLRTCRDCPLVKSPKF